MSNLTTLFTDIADSIREKEGSSEQIPAMDFPERIDGLKAVQIGEGSKGVYYDTNGIPHEVEEVASCSFGVSEIWSSGLNGSAGDLVAVSDTYVFCAYVYTDILDDDVVSIAVFDKDGNNLKVHYAGDEYYGADKLICEGSVAIASMRSNDYPIIFICNSATSKKLYHCRLLSKGTNGFWTFNEDDNAINKYDYSADHQKIESISRGVSTATRDLFIDEMNEVYYLLGERTVDKYSVNNGLVFSADIGGDLDYSYMHALENGCFVLRGSVYSGEFERKYTVNRYRNADSTMSVIDNNIAFTHHGDDSNCTKYLLLPDRCIPIWSYYKGSASVYSVDCDTDYVFLEYRASYDSDVLLKKFPQSNTTDHIIITKNPPGGGTVI